MDYYEKYIKYKKKYNILKNKKIGGNKPQIVKSSFNLSHKKLKQIFNRIQALFHKLVIFHSPFQNLTFIINVDVLYDIKNNLVVIR